MKVTAAQMKDFIDQNPPIHEYSQQQTTTTPYNGKSRRLDVKEYLTKYGIEVVGEKQHGNSTLHILEECVFDPSHKKEASIGQTLDGKLFYQCFHNSCKDFTWHDARKVISGDDPLFEGRPYSRKTHRVDLNKDNKDNEDNQDNKGSKGRSGHQPDSLRTSSGQQGNFIGDIRELINVWRGEFTNNDVISELCLRTRQEKKSLSNALHCLEKEGKIKKIEHKRANWKVVEAAPKVMNIFEAQPDPINIPLPLGISDIVTIRPGTIILIAGSNNSGKTSFLLWILHQLSSNNDPHTPFINKREERGVPEPASPLPIRYLNSEMSAGELKARLEMFGDSLSVWANVEFVERSRNFDDLILPDAITFIDFLEVNEDFFNAGKFISEIHQQLNTGVVIIAMQKKQGFEFAKGGEMTLEKPRLAINLDKNEQFGFICKVVKAKEPKDYRNSPQGQEVDYLITSSVDFQPQSKWRFVNQNQRKAINSQYERAIGFVNHTGRVEGEI